MAKVMTSAVILMALCLSAWAQDTWEAVMQLKPGTKIEVMDQKLRVFKGKLASASDSGITLLTDKQPMTVAREDVYRITRTGRKRNVLLGMFIGAGTGVAIGIASPELGSGKCSQPWPGCVGPETPSALGVGGAAAGAIVGALVPPHRYIFYRAAPKPKQ